MKPFYSSLLLLALAVALSAGCRNKNDETTPQHTVGYAGVLMLEYKKGFPPFSTIVNADISVAKDRTVIFGAGNSQGFDSEDTSYSGGKPEVRIHMSGTLTFHSAKGEYHEYGGEEYLWIWVHTSVAGQMTVWSWDDTLGWVQFLDTPFSYEDTYSDGQMEFLIDDAVLGGDSIKKTLPDIHGTFTYGYTLQLVVIP